MQEFNTTAHKVLDVAEAFTQTRGFNAFSYKDLQREVGVKTSSIHYYFPTKQDLALAMTQRYVERFQSLLTQLAQKHVKGAKRIEALGRTYIEVLEEGKFCLCGMLASDTLSMPEVVNDKLQTFFKLMEEWIAGSIELAKEQEQFNQSVNAKSAAAHFLAALEGGMLIARAQKKPKYLTGVITEAINQLRR